MEYSSNQDSNATKILYIAHIIQLVIKAILNAFKVNIDKDVINSINVPNNNVEDNSSVCTTISKVSLLNSNA